MHLRRLAPSNGDPLKRPAVGEDDLVRFGQRNDTDRLPVDRLLAEAELVGVHDGGGLIVEPPQPVLVYAHDPAVLVDAQDDRAAL